MDEMYGVVKGVVKGVVVCVTRSLVCLDLRLLMQVLNFTWSVAVLPSLWLPAGLHHRLNSLRETRWNLIDSVFSHQAVNLRSSSEWKCCDNTTPPPALQAKHHPSKNRVGARTGYCAPEEEERRRSQLQLRLLSQAGLHVFPKAGASSWHDFTRGRAGVPHQVQFHLHTEIN